jgi:hypothetical protein
MQGEYRTFRCIQSQLKPREPLHHHAGVALNIPAARKVRVFLAAHG